MNLQNALIISLTLAVLGGIEGVVPVLGHGHQVLDPGDVGAYSEECSVTSGDWRPPAPPWEMSCLTSSHSSGEWVVSLQSGTPNWPWCGDPKVIRVFMGTGQRSARPLQHTGVL